jgi:hypothetical protein
MERNYAPSLVCRGQEDFFFFLCILWKKLNKRSSRFPILNNKTSRNFSYSNLQHVVLWYTKGNQPFLEEQKLKGVFHQRSLFPEFFLFDFASYIGFLINFSQTEVYYFDWDNSVFKVTFYELDDRCSILGEGREFSLRHHFVQTDSVSYGYRGSFPGSKAKGVWILSPPASVDVTNVLPPAPVPLITWYFAFSHVQVCC